MTFDLITDLRVFLAYSLEMEKEAAERLQKYSQMMEKLNHRQLAKTISELATFSQQHAEEIEELGKDLQLSLVATADINPGTEHSPETFNPENSTTTMSSREAVKTMLSQEQESADFYAEVASRTTHPQIRKFALLFAKEEKEHAATLETWLHRLPDDEGK